jgi:hypothetical protein
MDSLQLLGVAASLSLLAGWRLYATVAAVGLMMRFGLFHAPQHIAGLDALANPWIIGIAVAGALAELLADKVMWIDSIWDGIHSFVRPLGGALVALAVVDASDPAWQAAAFLLGGGAALLSHGAKSGARALVNLSPEPVSNIAVSTVEDGLTFGGLWLVLSHPAAAGLVALVLAAAAIALAVLGWRAVRRLRAWWR